MIDLFGGKLNTFANFLVTEWKRWWKIIGGQTRMMFKSVFSVNIENIHKQSRIKI